MIPLRDDNPARTAPIITTALIATCVVVFILEARGGDRAMRG